MKKRKLRVKPSNFKSDLTFNEWAQKLGVSTQCDYGKKEIREYLEKRECVEFIVNMDLTKKDEIKFLTIGGEHSISYGPIVTHLKHYPDMVLVHLDAHTDLRDGYLEEKFSHASIIRRVLDHFTSKNRLIQYGIRSGPREEFNWMKENKTLATSLKECCEWLEEIPDTRPIYLTLDLDFFDPGFFPGTGRSNNSCLIYS